MQGSIARIAHLPYPNRPRSTMIQHSNTVDKLVIFLAKRDGIDKLVKTFQYVSKLVHYKAEPLHPAIALRAKLWEVASGLSRKAFRSGRFLSGFNALRHAPDFSPLSIFANAGEMVYFFFDHFLWLARVGVLDPSLARCFSFVSAFGESVGYVFFISLDVIAIRKGLFEQRRLISGKSDQEETEKKGEAIRVDRVMRLTGIAANLADLIIAIADIEPNPFCSHAVTLGISGLVSAWAGWYRNWPASAC